VRGWTKWFPLSGGALVLLEVGLNLDGYRNPALGWALIVCAVILFLFPLFVKLMKTAWNLLKYLYGAYGVHKPMASLIVVAVIGAALGIVVFGGIWLIAGEGYKADQVKKPSEGVAEDATAWARDPRRQNIIEKLRLEYVRNHPNARAGGPPTDWTNQRLKEMGEKWRYEPLGESGIGVVDDDGNLTGFYVKNSKGSFMKDCIVEGSQSPLVTGFKIIGGEGNVMERNEIGPGALGQRVTTGFDMKDTKNSAMRDNRIFDQPDFPALIESERISHEEKWKNLPSKKRYKLRKDFKALVEKIQRAKDQDKSALLIELNTLP
jgi:hypothetical protein